MEALHQFNLDVVVIPRRNRIQWLYTDEGGQLTERGFRNVCQTIGVELELAATVTSQQIGVSRHYGKPLVEKTMTRC